MNGDLPSLDLAVVTYGIEGIKRVAKMVLSPTFGVSYVVSWQNHDDAPVPDELRRDDITILRMDGRGISRNRNNALANCKADLVLFADDDIIYTEESFRNVREVFLRNPGLDVAVFRSNHGDMSRFPDVECRLGEKLPSGYYVTSFEIAFRRRSAAELRCCEELGLGAPELHGGEDEIFLMSAIRRGLDCRYFPVTICAHPHDSTGTKALQTPGNLMASGCVIALMYPRSAWLRAPLKAWRIWRSGRASLTDSFGYVLRGAMMARGVRRRNRDCLW